MIKQYITSMLLLAASFGHAVEMDFQLLGGLASIHDIDAKPLTIPEFGTISGSLEYEDTFMR